MRSTNPVPVGFRTPAAFASHRWALLPLAGAALILAGCATRNVDANRPAPPIVAESIAMLGNQLGSDGADSAVAFPTEFLELPDDIRDYLDREVVSLRSEELRYRALRRWALEEFSPQYEYDPSYTAPIEELKSSGRINCFSFSNLFVAAARYTDVPAHFQLVESPPQWDINDEYWVVSQHINVSGLVYRELTKQEKAAYIAQNQSTGSLIRRTPPKRMRRTYVVDLNPEIAVDAYRSRIISDGAALALFHSNRSVEELLAGNGEAAMAHGRAAIAADERSPTAWNNFGVLLSRQGNLEGAEQAYLTALALESDSESAANNLERIYRQSGDLEKAAALAKRIRKTRLKNPYYHHAMGERSLADGDLEGAADHFKSAIRRKEDEPRFYYALAETQIKLGDYKKAAKNLAIGKKHSNRSDMRRYHILSYQLSQATGKG